MKIGTKTSSPVAMPHKNPAKPFPAWRLPNGMIKASDGELEGSIGSCEFWEWHGGALVIVGVVVTVAIAAIHPEYDSWLEQWGTAIADSFVAIGVAVEIKFGQMAGLRHNELKRRSDILVGVANERASEANAKAAEAQAELGRMKTPRSLSVEKRSRIATILRPLGPVPFDFALQLDSESEQLMKDIGDALEFAGWIWQSHLSPIGFNAVGKPKAGIVAYAGLCIQITESRRLDWSMAVNALRAVLEAEDISVTLHQAVPDEQDTPNAIHITVGKKP